MGRFFEQHLEVQDSLRDPLLKNRSAVVSVAATPVKRCVDIKDSGHAIHLSPWT